MGLGALSTLACGSISPAAAFFLMARYYGPALLICGLFLGGCVVAAKKLSRDGESHEGEAAT
jgi:hypothetical protein